MEMTAEACGTRSTDPRALERVHMSPHIRPSSIAIYDEKALVMLCIKELSSQKVPSPPRHMSSHLRSSLMMARAPHRPKQEPGLRSDARPNRKSGSLSDGTTMRDLPISPKIRSPCQSVSFLRVRSLHVKRSSTLTSCLSQNTLKCHL